MSGYEFSAAGVDLYNVVNFSLDDPQLLVSVCQSWPVSDLVLCLFVKLPMQAPI